MVRAWRDASPSWDLDATRGVRAGAGRGPVKAGAGLAKGTLEVVGGHLGLRTLFNC